MLVSLRPSSLSAAVTTFRYTNFLAGCWAALVTGSIRAGVRAAPVSAGAVPFISLVPFQVHDLALRRCALGQLHDELAPALEHVPALAEILRLVVGAGRPSFVSGNVREKGLAYVREHAETIVPRGASRASKIMQTPFFDTARKPRIELSFTL